MNYDILLKSALKKDCPSFFLLIVCGIFVLCGFVAVRQSCLAVFLQKLQFNTEMYRSGHNENDSKFYGDLVVSSAGNPPFIRVFKIKNRIFFSVLSCFSLQKFFDRNFNEEKSGLKYTWSGIEVVITGLTRNQLYLTVPWVRIPPTPPSKKPVNSRVCGLFLFFAFPQNPLNLRCSLLKSGENTSKNQPNFCAVSPSSHRLPKSPLSGKASPVSIACADVILEL